MCKVSPNIGAQKCIEHAVLKSAHYCFCNNANLNPRLMQQYSQFNRYCICMYQLSRPRFLQLLIQILIFCDTFSKVQNVNLQILDKLCCKPTVTSFKSVLIFTCFTVKNYVNEHSVAKTTFHIGIEKEKLNCHWNSVSNRVRKDLHTGRS